MKKAAMVLVVMAVILYAMPALAGGDGNSKPAKPCGKSSFEYFFQSASDSIASCRPKPWLTRPMKQIGTIEKGQPVTFQKLADTIEGKKPAEAKSEVPPAAKSEVPAEAKSEVPPAAKSEVPAEAKSDIPAEAKSEAPPSEK